ncbi:MAG: hypothetical protein GKR90_20350 [Pseudomonadales bacterium]|nr:hypothetical protein [Pseudomonadales bacterium]
MLFSLPVVLGVALQGCQTAPATPDKPDPTPPTAPPPKSIDNAVLFPMLDAADQAIENDHLTYPPEGSAYAIFNEILAIDPDQEDAQRGLERIVEEYVALSMQALERRQFATARSMLTRARLINPMHPSIEPSAAQIRLIEEADRTTLQLQQTDLTSETERIQDKLRALGRETDGKACRFIITASNDGQGRWIYQRLSEDVETTRLRAQIKIRTPASVERLCFSS